MLSTVAFLVACARPASSSQPAQKPVPTVAEVTQKIRTAYSKVRSYSDTVLVYDLYEKPKKLIGRARISFTAPNTFRFVLDQYLAKRTTTVSQTGGKRHTNEKHHGKDRLDHRIELFNEIPAENSLEFDLIHYLLREGDKAGYMDWDTVARERLAGRACFRLSSYYKYRAIVTWVDAKTYLIIQARETYEFKFDRSELHVFHPKVK